MKANLLEGLAQFRYARVWPYIYFRKSQALKSNLPQQPSSRMRHQKLAAYAVHIANGNPKPITCGCVQTAMPPNIFIKAVARCGTPLIPKANVLAVSINGNTLNVSLVIIGHCIKSGM
jgi:hypothetical protein